MTPGITQALILLDIVMVGAGAQLGHPDYWRRETASAALESLGQLALPY
jgi:hypothetical protein